MMASDFIVDVSESDFEYEVLAYSQQAPVVVDFWAEWCGPCKTLGPLLERLAHEGQGAFRLAKVNVDQNQNLAIRYGVTSIPAVKAFRNGAIAAEFTGLRPEPRVREFILALAPTPVDLALEKGSSLLDLRKPQEAELTFRKALEGMPGRPEALLGLSRSLVLQGQGREALELLARFPASKEYAAAQNLLPLARYLDQLERDQALGAGEDPLDPAFHNAMRLVRRGNLEAAMDGLLDILRENKRYRDGLARQAMLGLLEALGNNNPLTRQYRSELAMLLF
ncbi:MAG: tetratricopeptide repeat protein [Chloroflexota bacterium]